MGSAQDMVRSLALVGIGVALVAAFMMWKQPNVSQYRVDVASTLANARSQADYPILALAEDADGWTANTVVFRPVDTEPGASEWRIGYLHDDRTYLAVNASDVRDAGAFIRGIARFANPTGETHMIDGRQWTVHESKDVSTGEITTLWVHSDTEPEPFIIVVTGNTPATEYAAFVQALRAE